MKNQTFGIEIECYGVDRTKVATAVAGYFGTTASRPDHTCYRTQTIPTGDGRHWKVMRDASLPGPDDQKIELVSPICRWEDIETVQALVRLLRHTGVKVAPVGSGWDRKTCGIHVHIGKGEHTPESLRRLVNIVNAKEDFLEEALEIDAFRREHWCKPVDQRFLTRLNREKPKSMERLAQLWYDSTDWERHANTHYDDSRYHLLNLHAVWQKGTIEFRAFNSTLHAGEVKAYIQLCMAISHKALKSASASPRRPETDNHAYAFRCWLLQLGMIGEEFATARHHLMKKVPGNAAWRNGDPTHRRDD